MKRIAAVAVAVAVLVPAVYAFAGPVPENQFEGRIERDPNTYMGLDIVRQNGKKFIAHGLGYGPYTCIGGSQGFVTFTTGKRIKISDGGRFRAVQNTSLANGKAIGTLRISGRVNRRVIKGSAGWRLEDEPGPGDDCYTGQLAYKVSKDNEVEVRSR
jgi:hypothetical protein